MSIGAFSSADLAVVRRPSRKEPFDVRLASMVRNVNLAGFSELGATVTSDGLTMYLSSNRSNGAWGLWESTRTDLSAEFPAPTELKTLNMLGEGHPYVAASGSIYFHTWREDSSDIWMSRRTSGGFAPPERVSVSGPGHEQRAVLSPDELTIYYQRQNVVTDAGIWMATRDSIKEPFRDAHPLRGLNVFEDPSAPSWVSPDACRLYVFANDSNGRPSLFVAERPVSPGWRRPPAPGPRAPRTPAMPAAARAGMVPSRPRMPRPTRPGADRGCALRRRGSRPCTRCRGSMTFLAV
jgi:hypothetical protein